jgi:hypothetical protein
MGTHNHFAGHINGRGLASTRRTGSRHEDGGNTHASLSVGLSVIQPTLFPCYVPARCMTWQQNTTGTNTFMKHTTKHTKKTEEGPQNASASGTLRIGRMVIPPALKAKAEEIFTAQPAIANYLGGSPKTTKLSAEAFNICALYEVFQFAHADIPIISEAELAAKEAEVRRELTATDGKSPLSVWASALNEETEKLTSVGAVEPVSDITSALIKEVTVINCLVTKLNATTKQSQQILMKLDDPAAFNLVVEGRADLTKLKKHILTGGGKGFFRNEILAQLVPRGLCKDLLTRGTFIPGQDAILLPEQRKPANRQNRRQRSPRKRAERWIGFGLKEGIWGVSSWLVHNNKILETRRPEELYFGMPLNRPFCAFLNKLDAKFPKAEAKAQNVALMEIKAPPAE